IDHSRVEVAVAHPPRSSMRETTRAIRNRLMAPVHNIIDG
ncbi:MAG: hypothetical protein QOD31_2306, partial [Pseudonocardiales bacterium]|nr:hypothetical protein [Pseudonocardiales bacterium]